MPWRARVAESRLPAAGRELVAAPIRASLSRAMHRGSVTSAANTARPAARSSSRPHKPRRATPGWPWRGPILLGHRCDRPVAGRRGRSPVDSPGAARYPAEPPTWTEPSGGRCRSCRSSCPPDPPAASFGLTPRDVAHASRRLERRQPPAFDASSRPWQSITSVPLTGVSAGGTALAGSLAFSRHASGNPPA